MDLIFWFFFYVGHSWAIANTCDDEPQMIQASTIPQFIVTPGFEKGIYEPNLNCQWIVKSSSDRGRIQLTIYNSYFEGPIFTYCDDYVLVRDMVSNRTQVSQTDVKWCDFTNPLSIISSNQLMFVQMVTDGNLNRRGANMSFVEFQMPGCPNGWQIDEASDSCFNMVKVQPSSVVSRSPWVTAQYHCNFDKSNLATISQSKYNALKRLYGNTKHKVWIGMFDARTEQKFENIVSNEPTWPSDPSVEGNNDNKDCVFVDLSDSSEKPKYYAANCNDENPFICERRLNGATIPFPPPVEIIEQSLKVQGANAGPIWLWLLIAAILLILLLILIPYCYKKHQGRKTAPSSDADSRDLIHRDEDSPQQHVREIVQNAMHQNVDQQVVVEVAPTVSDGSQIDHRETPTKSIVSRPASAISRHSLTASLGDTEDKVAVLPPIERFERPYIKMLDNVSALSLDEFWSKIEKSRAEETTSSPPENTNTGSSNPAV